MAPALLDRPVSPHEHGSGEGDAHGAGRLLIENRLELGGPLDGQITGAGALEDLVDEDRGAAVHLGEVDTVGHEASSLRELGEAYGGQAPSGREVGNRLDICVEHPIFHNHNGRDALVCHRLERPLEIGGPTYVHRVQLQLQGLRHRHHGVAERSQAGVVGIDESGDADGLWERLLDQLQPLGRQLRIEERGAVTFPPGFARLFTSPEKTASPTEAMTMGMVVVAPLAARVPGVPWVTSTSTLSRTSSAASSGARSY